MRILLVIETMFPLGPAQQLNLLARELADRGHDVHVAILRDNPASAFRVPKFCHIHHLEISSRDFLGWRKLRKLAKSIRPDVCNDWSCNLTTQAAIGDLYPHISTQLYSQQLVPDDISCETKKLWDRCRGNKSSPTFATIHDSIAGELVADGVATEKVIVIPPTCPQHKVHPSVFREEVIDECGLPGSPILVGTHAPLLPATRLKDLIWATDLLACIRKDVHFLIIGDGPQKNRLKRFLRTTEANAHVHFVGLPANADRIVAGLNAYWQSHLLWPLANGMLAAMHAAVPVVSVLGSETEQAIVHQTTGLGVNLGARDEFARWVKYIIEQKESAEQLGQQGQAYVKDKFPLEPFVDSYTDLYQEHQL